MFGSFHAVWLVESIRWCDGYWAKWFGENVLVVSGRHPIDNVKIIILCPPPLIFVNFGLSFIINFALSDKINLARYKFFAIGLGLRLLLLRFFFVLVVHKYCWLRFSALFFPLLFFPIWRRWFSVDPVH